VRRFIDIIIPIFLQAAPYDWFNYSAWLAIFLIVNLDQIRLKPYFLLALFWLLPLYSSCQISCIMDCSSML
jgi:hypothetical protein